jgi:two-component system, OmpR family, sensor histidine kinase KdpD
MVDTRPNPDQLLAELEREEQRRARGKLKIFFGASAGVGKTYAMLAAAQAAKLEGVHVVVGLVETHGRKETLALLQGLEALPLKEIEYRGRTLKEFDLDAALARKPALILVDELAHSNVPGSRHPRRWRDIEELLAAGIDVYSTLNVQHIESLNDVVGGITNIRVSETVPDTVFDEADDVVLVDITPDELLRRLKEGKVYLPEQAERALEHFFRKGNLIALRELALRRTADRVDVDVRAYRDREAVQRVWATRETLMAGIGPDPGAEQVVRACARLAERLGANWHAVYVETPALQRLADDERQRILRVLALAQELGAETATLPGTDVAAAFVAYARKHNVAKLVVGRRPPNPWLPWRRSVGQRVARLAPEIDLVHVAQTVSAPTLGNRRWSAEHPDDGETRTRGRLRYLWAVAACAGATALGALLFPTFDATNIAMLYLLVVMLIALRFGRGPAALAAIISVAAFDWFFVPPRFTFAVADVQYLLTFAVLLAVGLITGQLTANLRYQARVSEHRAGRVQSLYEMARELSAALTTEQVVEIGVRFVEASFRGKVAIVLADLDNKLFVAGRRDGLSLNVDMSVAQWAYDHAQQAGFGTDTLPASAALYIPLKAPVRIRGVLALEPSVRRWLLIPEQRRQLETFCTLIAIAIERVHFVDVARDALVKMESERLRNSLLSALSHDLRTPLTALVGLADSLTVPQSSLSPTDRATAAAVHEEAIRLSTLVHNLLDMARLQAGEIKLNREWQHVEEVVGSALRATKTVLGARHIEVSVPHDLPLVRFDAVLIERVLCNLLENAAKYTPNDATVRIEAHTRGDDLELSVTDNGPGLPPGKETEVFDKFMRGTTESSIAGVGLGLAICRSIVEAHGGKIRGERGAEGGARFIVTLPIGTPPALPAEPMVEARP